MFDFRLKQKSLLKGDNRSVDQNHQRTIR